MHIQPRRTKEQPSYFAFPYTQKQVHKILWEMRINKGVVGSGRKKETERERNALGFYKQRPNK